MSNKELKTAADKAIIPVLKDLGFHENEWSFEPKQVRYLLQTLASIFGILSLYSIVIKRLSYHWMFIVFASALGSLYYFWYNYVEYGGGKFLFSPDWQDSYMNTYTTETNYVVKLNIGYTREVVISLPFSSFKMAGTEVDPSWLEMEIVRKFGNNQ